MYNQYFDFKDQALAEQHCAIEISFTKEYGAIVYEIESLREGAAMDALKIYLGLLKSVLSHDNERCDKIESV